MLEEQVHFPGHEILAKKKTEESYSKNKMKQFCRRIKILQNCNRWDWMLETFEENDVQTIYSGVSPNSFL
jgi:hypothetical protein